MVSGGEGIKSNTGKAQIKKQGHTTSGTGGSEYQRKARYGGSVREISPKD